MTDTTTPDAISLDPEWEGAAKVAATVEAGSLFARRVDGCVPFQVRLCVADNYMASPFWMTPGAARELAALLVRRADEADAAHADQVKARAL